MGQFFLAPEGQLLLALRRKADLNNGIRYAIATDDDGNSRNERDIALGWEDIQHLTTGTVTKTFPDDT